MTRTRTFAVGRRKGPTVSIWLAGDSGVSARRAGGVDCLPWRVAALVRGPLRPATQAGAGGAQRGADAARSLSSASMPAASEIACRASATPSSNVGTLPAT